MTKLLITAQNQNEVAVACASGADIIDLVPSREGFDSFLAICARQIKARASLSIGLDVDMHSLSDWKGIWDEADIIRLSATNIKEVDIKRAGGDVICHLARQKQLILMLDAPFLPPYLLDFLVGTGQTHPHVVMLETTQPLLRQYSLTDLQDFINKAHENAVQVALSGLLEVPDIPRLLRLSPDILAFARDKKSADDYFATTKLRQMIRTLIPEHERGMDIAELSHFGTDRLIVRDFVLPIEIGAYQHERGKRQRVRFNVFADVARLSDNPQDMRHIFSYDLITDAIRQLVGCGHIDLVETLAEQIAAAILCYPNVKSVVVRVEKLDLEPGAVGVEIKRDNP